MLGVGILGAGFFGAYHARAIAAVGCEGEDSPHRCPRGVRVSLPLIILCAVLAYVVFVWLLSSLLRVGKDDES